MPRETIIPVSGPYEAKVGWSPDRGVQVGVSVEGDRSLFWQLLETDKSALSRLGEQVRQLGELSYDDDEHRARVLLNTLDVVSGGGYAGIWTDLDRRGCNDLIRILRRARDSAYGRDE